jgi:hypothetical protein
MSTRDRAYSLSFKVPVVIREDYTMLLELHADLIWFHSDVRKWTPSVKIKYLGDLHLLQYLTSVPLVALIDEENTKLAKFARTIGFEFKQPLLGQDKKMYHICSRSL